MGAYAELDIVLAQEHGVTTHQRDSGFSGHTGSCATFAEHNGDFFASQAASQRAWGISSLDSSLVRSAIAHESSKFGGSQVTD